MDEERHVIQIDERCLQAAQRCGQKSKIQDIKITQRSLVRCVIIGNGPSRLRFRLEDIPYTTFGCNEIYRDFRVDYLLAQDKEVLHRMQQDNIDQPVYVAQSSYRLHRDNTYTQLPDMRQIRFPYTRMSSWLTGEQAIVLAAQLKYKIIDLIGFDGGVQSIYRKDQTHAQPTLHRYNKTIPKILEYYPNLTINISVDNLRAH